MVNNKKPFRLGVLGGMGPMAGVWFQKLIIDSTPAQKDQDHIQVICFTNPKIPDRTKSLAENKGRSYVKEICKSINLLTRLDINYLAIPCNTAHARLREIQKNTAVPILDMVDLVVAKLNSNFFKVGILATAGTLKEKVYQSKSGYISWIEPNKITQQKISKIIYDIKAGQEEYVLENIAEAIEKIGQDAEVVILACTELSLYTERLRKLVRIPIVDPLEVLAQKIVELGCK